MNNTESAYYKNQSNFNEVLKEHIIDIYTKLKQLNGSYVEFIADITTRDQYEFALVISDVYTGAMTATLTELTNHNESFNQDTFQKIMSNKLYVGLVFALKKVFGKETKPISKPAEKEEPDTNIKRVNLTCEDLKNNIELFVDNQRIMCESKK